MNRDWGSLGGEAVVCLEMGPKVTVVEVVVKSAISTGVWDCQFC